MTTTRYADMTILRLVDAMTDATLTSGAPDGGEAECEDIRAEIKRRLAEVYAQGSLGGRIRSLIGDDVKRPAVTTIP